MSPIFPSPMHDFGYDVADYKDVDPVFGSLADFDSLVAAARERGLDVLLDLVPCHTSIEHPWFREHPDWYIWADAPNNWLSAFGGSAWSRRDGRWYLHSFYPEQPDLDWRNPEVVAAMQDVLRFWLERGVAGYRVDAIDRLLKDAQLRDDPPAAEPFGLPLCAGGGAAVARALAQRARHRRGAREDPRGRRRRASWSARCTCPRGAGSPTSTRFDAVFAFELLHADWDAEALRTAIDATTRQPGAAWVLSNHDFGRLVTRFGAENARAAAMLLLTLPGTAFLYQGDEIGQADGPGGERRYDRAGRDRFRHPMQWDGSRAAAASRAASRGCRSSTPSTQRRGAARRPRLDAHARARADPAAASLPRDFRLLDAAPGVLAYARGEHVVALNTTGEPLAVPRGAELVLETEAGVLEADELAAHGAAITGG